MFLSQLWSWSFSFYIPYNYVGQKSQGHIYLFRYKPSLPPFYPHCSLLSLLPLHLPFPFLSFPILPTYPFLLPVSHAPFSPHLFLLLGPKPPFLFYTFLLLSIIVSLSDKEPLLSLSLHLSSFVYFLLPFLLLPTPPSIPPFYPLLCFSFFYSSLPLPLFLLLPISLVCSSFSLHLPPFLPLSYIFLPHCVYSVSLMMFLLRTLFFVILIFLPS